MIVLSLWLCLAKLVELVGLGCAVLVVASLCSAWRPPPPASMKAAAWPAAAFLHSRAAAQLPTQPPPQLLPLKSCRDHNCRSCHRQICIQPNTTTQLREPISAHSKPTHTTTSEAGATTHKTANNRAPNTPQRWSTSDHCIQKT